MTRAGITAAQTVADMSREESRAFLRALPGYPFLPCKICGFDDSCEHIGWERAKAWHPGLVLTQPAGRTALAATDADRKERA